jgi:hypothetical protein
VTAGGRQMVLDSRGRAKNWSVMFNVPTMKWLTGDL